MAADYTTAGLVAAIKRRGSIPTNQQLFSNDDFIALANDELQSSIVPMLMAVREDYFITSRDVAAVSSQGSPAIIPIPSDAVGQKLTAVSWVDGSGNLTNIPRLTMEEVSGNFMDYTQASGFYVKGNNIVLFPNLNNGTGTVRLSYVKRPLHLVPITQAGKIRSINPNTNEVTLTNLPSAWVTGDLVNVVSHLQPFDTVASSVVINGISSPTIVVSDLTGIEVGMWVALDGSSPIPQIPVEAHITLAQATTVKCLEALGDREGMQAAEAKLKQNKEDLLTMITPRVDASPKKVTNAGNGILDWSRTTQRRPW